MNKQEKKQNVICDKYNGIKEPRESVIMILRDREGNETVRKL